MNNLEFAKKMQQRTMDFAVQAVRFFVKLPKSDEARIPGKQFLRAGTSVGANYRAACRAKSSADFISKMGTVEEEADESGYWMELLIDSGRLPSPQAGPLLQEANELTAIAVSSIQTARRSGAHHVANLSTGRS